MTSAEIRQRFLEFFRSKGHEIVPSAPIVVKDDPTLMFTNAGMNQFKDYFLGNKKAKNARVADTQKCLRVSGKHNDLEEVGVDTYHHTMFEMLGNWSFGDYFKKEAIAWSWELLTEVYKIPKDRLYVTIFKGDAAENLPADDEAVDEWKKWIHADRILPFGKKDNFWEMGDTGPCGPCTEIHVDTRTDEERKSADGKTLVNADHPQVIEIWNNVFIQFNRLKDSSLEPLPAKHVDTGMGFERLVRVLQQKQSNYDTDVFTDTIKEIEKVTGKKYNPVLSFQSHNESATDEALRRDEAPPSEGFGEAVAFRVLADHIRAIAFTIADGQLPSNTGAGYVIRRILRRAARYYYSYLDYKQPLLHQLVPVIAKQFENVFPELKKQEDFIKKVVKEEEEAFLRTLVRGLQLFYNLTREPLITLKSEDKEDFIEQMNFKSSYSHVIEKKIIPGVFAFKLTDTYGFPIDLINLLAQEEGWKVSMQEYDELLQQQKERSRAATAIDTEDWVIVNNGNSNEFVGYDSLETKAKILKYRKVKAKGKEAYQIVLDKTPFYAESGGQVGDHGVLTINHSLFTITDTKKENDLIIHFAENIPDDLSGEVIAKVDAEKRKRTELHHSATHLLHAALRQVLGNHVAQKGSLVNDEHLRFDFSHFSKVNDEEISKVENIVNEKIRENIPVVIKQMSKEEAMKMGAMALFGEKYGDTVRVVIIDPQYSVELCGGTHVGATGELGFFKITHETAVAAGVRRIEAVCGKMAETYIHNELEIVNAVREKLKNPKDIIKGIENFQTENAALKKKLEQLEIKQLAQLSRELAQKVIVINNINFVGEVVEVNNAESLKKLGIDIKTNLTNYIIVLAANVEGKAAVIVLMDEKLSGEKNLEAQKIIRENIAPLIKGGGGGQKALATAGGQDAGKLPAVIEAVKKLIE